MNKLDKIDEMHEMSSAHEVKPFIIEEISDIVTEDINYKTSQTDPIYTTNIEKIIIGYESSYESSESFDSFTSLDSFTSTENTPTNVITNLQKNIWLCQKLVVKPADDCLRADALAKLLEPSWDKFGKFMSS